MIDFRIMRRRVFVAAGISAALAATVAYYSRVAADSMHAMRAANAAAKFAGRRAVVVGGTSGIGEGVALRLAQAQFAVSIVGRSAERGRAIVAQLHSINPAAHHEFLECDAELLANAKACAAAFRSRHDSLDVLVLSQGIGTFQGRTPTSEDIDQKLALHYYGRMAFITSLLPALRRSPSPRVMSILTAGVHPHYPYWAEDPELREHYSLKNAADAGCFYNDLAMDSLSRDPDNAGATFMHAAPGFVASRLGSDFPWPLPTLLRALHVFARSPADAAEYLCAPLLRPDDDPSLAQKTLPHTAVGGAGASSAATPGKFLLLDQYARPAPTTSGHTPEARESVWQHTLAVLRRTGVIDGVTASGAAMTK